MTTVVMNVEKTGDYTVRLNAFTDKLLSGAGSFSAQTEKVYSGDNYLIASAGMAAVKEVIEAWTIKHPVMPTDCKLKALEWLGGMTDFLKQHGVMAGLGAKPYINTRVMVVSYFGVYDIVESLATNVGSVSTIGSGSAAFNSLHAISKVKTLIVNDEEVSNVLYNQSIRNLAAMAIESDPKSDGFSKHTLEVDASVISSSNVVYRVENEGLSNYILNVEIDGPEELRRTEYLMFAPGDAPVTVTKLDANILDGKQRIPLCKGKDTVFHLSSKTLKDIFKTGMEKPHDKDEPWKNYDTLTDPSNFFAHKGVTCRRAAYYDPDPVEDDYVEQNFSGNTVADVVYKIDREGHNSYFLKVSINGVEGLYITEELMQTSKDDPVTVAKLNYSDLQRIHRIAPPTARNNVFHLTSDTLRDIFRTSEEELHGEVKQYHRFNTLADTDNFHLHPNVSRTTLGDVDEDK